MGGFVAAFLISVGIWCIRFKKYDRPGVKSDFKWVFLCLLWLCRHNVYSGIVRNSASIWIAAITLLICAVFYHLISHLSSNEVFFSQYADPDNRPEMEAPNTTFSHLKPLIFPCRTSHTRMFPKIHSFSYSYLFVGIPVGWQGSLGRLLSADLESYSTGLETSKAYRQRQNSWFTVEAADYLNRGSQARGLKGKLDDYLKSQDEDPEDYTHAYLVTAPRFLGYSFNPVSFWYLYNKENELKAMILEVNNTFDERRIYLLKDTEERVVKPVSEGSNGNVENGSHDEPKKPASIEPSHERHSSTKFTTKWAKDFHVSPFNSRKGSYALSAHDPFFPCPNGKGAINNIVTLRSSKDHVKLIARVFSTRSSIDPSSLGRWQRLRLVASWGWVGFVTYPRIVREAAKLFFRRKLHVWYRPEVLKDSIGRRETEDERIIELCFRDYLRHRIQNSSPLDRPLKYTSAISTATPPSETFSPSLNAHNPSEEPLTLQITTPLFYTLLALAPTPASLLPPQTYQTSHPALLATLFPSPPYPSPSPPLVSSPLLLTLRLLRARTRHPLDAHVHIHLPAPLARRYAAVAVKLLLAESLLGGFSGVLDGVGALVRVGLSYWCAQAGVKAWGALGMVGMDGMRGMVDGASGLGLGMGMGMGGWTLGLFAVHSWWFAGLFL